jgi:hypothetical protein
LQIQHISENLLEIGDRPEWGARIVGPAGACGGPAGREDALKRIGRIVWGLLSV